MKYNLKSSEKLSLMNIQSNHTKAWYLYFPLIIMLNDIYFSILILICCHSANFDFLIYIFAQLGSRCLIVAFKLGASIKYPTLYLHQHPIPIFFFLVNLISKIHLIISNFFKHPPLWLFSTSIKYLTLRQYYTLLEQKAIILIFISIIDINVNLSKNEIDKKINLSWLKYQSTPLYIVAYVCT